MIVDSVGDTHGYFPHLKGGDLLLLAGDYTARDTLKEWVEFFRWLKAQKYRKKVMIAGNHDNFLSSGFPKSAKEAYELREVEEWLIELGVMDEQDFEYLCDSGCEFEGMKIWGSPWTSQFPGINPACCAFTRPFMETLADRWELIPEDTQILVTHGPPFGIFDKLGTELGAHVGDMNLRTTLDQRPKIKLHVFGHIHEHGGQQLVLKRPGFGTENNTVCVNASFVNERYQPMNLPVRVIL